jgi:hypothetical protein
MAAQRPLPKIAQLVADTEAELQRLGIDTEGKRPEEILRMAREERNKPRARLSTQKLKSE